MPSPDATFRNIKRLHAVFAVSALALLAVTVWMVAADHWREWKVFQQTFRDRVEPWLSEAWVREQETADYAAREEELKESLAKAREAVPEGDLVRRFCSEVERQAARRGGEHPDSQAIEAAYEALAAEPGVEARRRLLDALSKPVAAAQTRREDVDRRLRFRRAEFDEARSLYESGVGEGLSADRLRELDKRVQKIKAEVAALAAEAEEASADEETLRGLLAQITRPEDEARKALAEHRSAFDRLGRALAEQRPSLGKRLLRMPIIDAFGRPLAIDQIWLPDLTIDYNFRRVARFDRCVTCHQGIDKTTPGSPSEPACVGEETLAAELAVPGPAAEPTLESLYGFSLAPRGILDAGEPTIGRVLARTPAADAGLRAGDVILTIDGAKTASASEVRQSLLNRADANDGPRAVKLDLRRGLPQPYTSHPRLDLFVGSLSPHPMGRFGCTICHAGQGSATAFRFASHTPNDLQQRDRWRRQHGWFRNEHWDFPMRPERFTESSCLRCHHAVTDLAPSPRFPDPPAPKLLQGYDLVRRYGCFGCHEIKGIDASGKSIGPDMRLERSDGVPAADDPIPGTMRKVGPSLRDVAGKLDAAFIDRWLANPQAVRPDTRMPRIFGLWGALEGKSLEDAKRFEAAEAYAVTEYLLGASQPVALLPPPAEVTEPPSAERGKRLFLTQGCLACHKHRDFPEGQFVQGPNLSDLAAKLNTETGRAWLLSWIRDPARHSPRTLMPNTLLEPVPLPSEEGADGENAEDAPRRMTDPAADIAAYLLDSAGAKAEPAPRRALVEADLDDVVLMHLEKAISGERARAYLAGTYELSADEAQGDAAELAGRITRAKKLRYLGRRTIAKRGCFGCHDIPGFEDAKPIGPALSDWGRKHESLLAFGQVHRLLAGSSGPEKAPAAASKGEGPREDPNAATDPDRGFYLEAVRSHRREGFIWQKLRAPRSFDYKTTENKGFNEWLTMGRFTFTPAEREAIITFVLGLVADPPAEEYLCQPDRRRRAIVEGRKVIDRYGCAECHVLEMERWQIRYDPAELEGPIEAEDFAFLKPPIDRAKLDAESRPDRRGLVHAEAVGMPQRDNSGEVLEDVDDDDHPLYYLNLWEPLALNVAGDWATWRAGSAQLGVSDPLRVFGGVSPGEAMAGLAVAQQRVRPTSAPQLAGLRPAWGGTFARLLFPHVLREDSPAVMEAWGWLPPPLVGEGAKVEPAWLRDYLLDPVAIRPASVLRMPKYTMSADEAGKLVDYFAAVAGADFPYGPDPRSRIAALVAKEKKRPNRLDDALRIVTDRTTFCTKCHLVGDYSPGGEITTTLAPRLDRVGRRLRPEYVRRWLAHPKSVLPYTGMPVNFPPAGPPVGQDLFKGESTEQIDAVVDLLVNYDEYMNHRTSIRAMIEAAQKACVSTPRDQ